MSVAFQPVPIGSIIFVFLSSIACDTTTTEDAGAGSDWVHYLGHPTSNQYSILDQINQDNVHQLEIAWTYDTGDSAMYQTNNLAVDGVVYTASPESKVMALNGATGDLIWTFDPDQEIDSLTDRDQRGLMFWEDGESDRRILTMKGNRLFALDAATGKPIPSFGEEGNIHLGENMDVEGSPNVNLNTPGQLFNDMFIIGSNVNEDVPGAVRAFDVRTGERKWIFHTLPRPGEYGSETWPEGYLEHTGGASDWSGLSLDAERGIVYLSTETAGPDFYGGQRYGENLFANSIVALDANTGERLWHYQLVHHDLWDLDNPAPPTLLTVVHQGEKRDIVAQGTKMGLLFVFDRVTGEPLWPIEERETPRSRIDEIKTWPTQPFPTKPPPLIRQKYTEDDISNISPRAQQLGEEILSRSGNYGAYPPPSLEQIIMFPGYDGGMEWGGSAADPDGILYVNVNEIPWFYQLVPTTNPDGQPLSPGERYYRANCASCHGIDRTGSSEGAFPSLLNIADRLTEDAVSQFIVKGSGRMPAFDILPEERRKAIINFLFDREKTKPMPSSQNSNAQDPHQQREDGPQVPPYVFRGFERWYDEEGYPAIKPPWGTLNAVDLNTGTIKWKVPLGEFEELTARGIPITGTENYGGPVVTASGLIFIGATMDRKFRAFNKETGELLWEAELPLDGNATPSTYLANGRQYVIISCGGAKMNPPYGGTLVAFSLPE